MKIIFMQKCFTLQMQLMAILQLVVNVINTIQKNAQPIIDLAGLIFHINCQAYILPVA